MFGYDTFAYHCGPGRKDGADLGVGEDPPASAAPRRRQSTRRRQKAKREDERLVMNRVFITLVPCHATAEDLSALVADGEEANQHSFKVKLSLGR